MPGRNVYSTDSCQTGVSIGRRDGEDEARRSLGGCVKGGRRGGIQGVTWK